PFATGAYFPAATFFSSAWNSARIALAFGTFTLAFAIQPSMIGPVAFFASALIAGLALTIFAPAAFRASIPTLSALSQDWPFERAAASPLIFSTMSWSCFESLFHLSSFMKKPKDELY